MTLKVAIIHHDYQNAVEALERELWDIARDWGKIARDDAVVIPDAPQAVLGAADKLEWLCWQNAERCRDARQVYAEIRERPLAEIMFILCVQGHPHHACYILTGDWSQGDVDGSYFA
jgi:hypothetical protein